MQRMHHLMLYCDVLGQFCVVADSTNTIMQSIFAIRNTHHHLDTSSSEEERKEQLATHQYSIHLLSV